MVSYRPSTSSTYKLKDSPTVRQEISKTKYTVDVVATHPKSGRVRVAVDTPTGNSDSSKSIPTLP